MTYDELRQEIANVYERGITLAEADQLAARFLVAMLDLGEELSRAAIDVSMRKTGVRAVEAATYMNAATEFNKKPSDTFIKGIVDQDKLVQDVRNDYEAAYSEWDKLRNRFSVYKEAHVYFRGVAKGRFE